jgi:hypothetical protein
MNSSPGWPISRIRMPSIQQRTPPDSAPIMALPHALARFLQSEESFLD